MGKVELDSHLSIAEGVDGLELNANVHLPCVSGVEVPVEMLERYHEVYFLVGIAVFGPLRVGRGNASNGEVHIGIELGLAVVLENANVAIAALKKLCGSGNGSSIGGSDTQIRMLGSAL